MIFREKTQRIGVMIHNMRVARISSLFSEKRDDTYNFLMMTLKAETQHPLASVFRVVILWRYIRISNLANKNFQLLSCICIYVYERTRLPHASIIYTQQVPSSLKEIRNIKRERSSCAFLLYVYGKRDKRERGFFRVCAAYRGSLSLECRQEDPSSGSHLHTYMHCVRFLVLPPLGEYACKAELHPLFAGCIQIVITYI